jgi:hypothetical protein
MVSERVAKLRAEHAAFLSQDTSAAARHVDQLVQQLEATRDLTRTIVHVDMDGTHRHGARATPRPMGRAPGPDKGRGGGGFGAEGGARQPFMPMWR